MSPKAEDLGERVAAGHATEKHLYEGKFADLGIETPEQFREFIANIVDSEETLCFTGFTTQPRTSQADFFYHEPTNTMVVDPFNQENEPTAYRPPDGIENFNRKLKYAEVIDDRSIEVFHGMGELHPEVEVAPTNDMPSEFEEFVQRATRNFPDQREEIAPDNDIDR